MKIKPFRIFTAVVIAILGLLVGAAPVLAPPAQPAAPRLQFIEFFSPM